MILRMGTAAAVVILLTLTAILTVPGRELSPLYRSAMAPGGGQAFGGAQADFVPTPEPTPAVLIGAGDISVCGLDGDDKTADLIERLLDRYPDASVFTAGDNAQTMGTALEYSECFQPSWGRFKSRIHPSPGNHDWFTEEGGPYFDYFGEAAGEPGLGYYSYNLGDWHIVSLNSNCAAAGCDVQSAQAVWLRADLEQNDKRCSMLYWHHPLWSSGKVVIDPAATAFWRIASEFNAEVVVNGHDHIYERLAPLGPSGRLELDTGIRPFIVGTGGAWHFEEGQPLLTSEARAIGVHGVIVFFLYPGRYDWRFIPVDDGSFTDSGSALCH